MDIRTEEEFYELLEALMQELADKKEYEEEYWRLQEEIHRWEKENAEEELEQEKERAELLQELAKAKTQKVLIFKDGKMQYVDNQEAIAQIQREMDGYASGTTSASGGLSMVGEHGAELRVLNKGDGIIPAGLTESLMQIGALGLDGLKNLGNNDTTIYNIQEIRLDKVDDVDSLFAGLRNLAYQST